MNETRRELVKQGKILEYLTLGYNALEGAVGVLAGIMSGSLALTTFGLDSSIEVISGGALLWRLNQDADKGRREKAEKRASQIVAFCFLALAVYVLSDSINTLLHHESAERSLVGIVLTVSSVIVMPLLGRAKRNIANKIGSGALAADASQSNLCAYLAAIVLGGLALNALFGWWWADPVASLAMLPIIVKEGIDGVRGETCTCHGPVFD